MPQVKVISSMYFHAVVVPPFFGDQLMKAKSMFAVPKMIAQLIKVLGRNI